MSTSPSVTRISGLERVKDQLTRCIACTECYGRGPHLPFADGGGVVPNWICPILDQFKFISYSGRSQQYMARLVAYGHAEPDESMAKVFYTCTTCGICDSICPRPLADTVCAMREEIRSNYASLYPGALMTRESNIRDKKNFFGASPEARDRWSEGLDVPMKADILYFAGCYASYRQPEAARAVVKLIRAAGQEVATVGAEEWCCGQPAALAGNWQLIEEMSLHNVEKIKASGAKRVVFSCPECYRAFKVDYPNIVGELPFEVAHVSELYGEWIRAGKLKLTQEMQQTVTYHDPCFLVRQSLGRRQDVSEPPRSAISAVPGVKFQDMDLNRRFAYCCGAGGGVSGDVYPEAAAWFAAKRSTQAAEVATQLITACPRCYEQLSQGARAEGLSLQVSDISEFLAVAAGL
jgi:heterodisulfide reductase subunit D